MSNIETLNVGDRHLLRLIRKDAKRDGWTIVSKQVWPFMSKLPKKLVELEEVGEAGKIRLSPEGNTVVDWLI